MFLTTLSRVEPDEAPPAAELKPKTDGDEGGPGCVVAKTGVVTAKYPRGLGVCSNKQGQITSDGRVVK